MAKTPKHKNSGIYKITNLVNGKMYIGSSVNIYSRKNAHFSALRRNSHYNPHLQRAFNKHGEDNFKFEKIELLIPKENLCTKERDYILKYDTLDKDKGYNLDLPASDNYPKVMTEETKEKLRRISLAQTGIVTDEQYAQWKKEKEIKESTPRLGLKKRIVVLDRFTKEYVATYESIAEAARETNSYEKRVSAVVNKAKYIKSHNGYIFIRESEYKEGG